MAKPATVDEYLAAAPEERRGGLEALRRTVRAAAPGAEECIAYDMPAYRVGGTFAVSFGAYKRHYSVFPASRVVLDALGDEAAAHARGRGTFQFPADRPLPLDLVDRIVRVRVAETTESLRVKAASKR